MCHSVELLHEIKVCSVALSMSSNIFNEQLPGFLYLKWNKESEK